MSGVTKVRNERIDALKFFAIALVVFGHVANLARYGNVLGDVVYVIRAFNMPLFMFLAGYVLFGREGQSPGLFLRRKFLALMVPYFVWATFELLTGDTAPSTWLRSLGNAALNPHISGRKWFLYVLFVFYVLFTLVRIASKRDKWLVAAAVVTVGLTFLPDGDYLGRLNVEWLFTFFIAGYFVAKHRVKLPDVRPAMAVGAIVVFAALLAIGSLPDHGSGWPPWYIAHSGDLFMRSGQMTLLVFLMWKYATAFAGIMASVSLYMLTDLRWLRWQAVAGRRSLGIYVTQGWLLLLSFGSGTAGILGSWLLVVYVALAVAMLLEKMKWTRVLFLGLPGESRRAT